MKRASALVALSLVLVAGTAQAQQEKASDMNMAASGINFVYSMAKSYIVKTAEQAPQELYSYKPTPEVRTLGQIRGHITNEQHAFCTVAEGKPMPEGGADAEKITDKAAMIAALNAAFSHCDAVYASATDAQLMESRTIFGMKMSLAGLLTFNAAHDMEHYGNLVTYLRMNKMVPPSSQSGN